ncbi:MAG: fumarylacetoacetate hydrolase family protein [Anaerolineales bacterium]
MRYVTFALPDSLRKPRLGAMREDMVVDLQAARTWAQGAISLPAEPIPPTLLELIHLGVDAQGYLVRLMASLEGVDPSKAVGAGRESVAHRVADVVLYPPLPRPMSLRDFYAFEAHVKSGYAIRDREVPKEWYEIPVFYFSNASLIYGPEESVPYPGYSKALDYELEVACVIGAVGRDISAEQAEQHIFGYTILNDWSARDEQRREMSVGLGPAKGKDFASSIGPAIVTPDELSDCAAERPGVYDLSMAARVNDTERSSGNWKEIHYSFGQMIERASADVTLMPGDIIGSGTVGSGSLLELTEGKGPWLQVGDSVELEIERLGVLRNRIGARTN